MCYNDAINLDINNVLYSGVNKVVYDGMYKGNNCIIKKITIDSTYGIASNCLKEINILSNLVHPNIVKILEIFYDDFNIYIILEHCGTSIINTNYEDIKCKNNAIKQLISAVKYIHNKGYFHGDINLHNICISTKGNESNYKIIDFDISSRIYRASNVWIGSTEYAKSPEQENMPNMKNDDVLKQDIWGLGVVLCYILSGIIINCNVNYKIDSEKIPTYIKNMVNSDKEKRPNFVKSNINTSAFLSNDNKYDKMFIKEKYLLSCCFSNLNILNNISNENIFIVFKNLNRFIINNASEYIIYAIILFANVTKMISRIDMPYGMICECNDMISEISLSVDIIKILEKRMFYVLNWIIDVETNYRYEDGNNTYNYLMLYMMLDERFSDINCVMQNLVINYTVDKINDSLTYKSYGTMARVDTLYRQLKDFIEKDVILKKILMKKNGDVIKKICDVLA